jgi:acetyl-CoA acyltransferase
MQDAVIVSAVRTAVAKGKADGALARAGVTPIDLAALVMKESALRGGVDPRHIDDVILGCAMPEASQGLNVARQAALKANFPVDASAATINRFCSSGLQSVASAVQAVMSGMQDVVVSGGVEMMSQVPMSGYHTRLHPALTESYIGMGFTAERVAERYDISREDQDAFAARASRRGARGGASGAVRRPDRRGARCSTSAGRGEKTVAEGVFDRDELPRGETTGRDARQAAARVQADGGTVTGRQREPLLDGAAAVMVMSREKAEAEGSPILARLVTYAVAASTPTSWAWGRSTRFRRRSRRPGCSCRHRPVRVQRGVRGAGARRRAPPEHGHGPRERERRRHRPRPPARRHGRQAHHAADPRAPPARRRARDGDDVRRRRDGRGRDLRGLPGLTRFTR